MEGEICDCSFSGYILASITTTKCISQDFQVVIQTGYCQKHYSHANQYCCLFVAEPQHFPTLHLPSLRAAARPLTTAMGCLRQNSCSCGLNASFLFSKYTEGVGGRSCSRVNRCCGGSGGWGGGALSERMLQLGTPFNPWPLKIKSMLKLLLNSEKKITCSPTSR